MQANWTNSNSCTRLSTAKKAQRKRFLKLWENKRFCLSLGKTMRFLSFRKVQEDHQWVEGRKAVFCLVVFEVSASNLEIRLMWKRGWASMSFGFLLTKYQNNPMISLAFLCCHQIRFPRCLWRHNEPNWSNADTKVLSPKETIWGRFLQTRTQNWIECRVATQEGRIPLLFWFDVEYEQLRLFVNFSQACDQVRTMLGRYLFSSCVRSHEGRSRQTLWSPILPRCDHEASHTWPHCGRSEFTHCKNGSCSIIQLFSRPKVLKNRMISQEPFL